MITAEQRGGRTTAILRVTVTILVTTTLLGSCTKDLPTTGSSATRVETGLQPPGTAIFDGLVVPSGAHLAGGVFAQALPSRNSYAVLTIDRDPYRVWDGFAAQARRLDFDIGGTADACRIQPLEALDGTGNSHRPRSKLEGHRNGDRVECYASAPSTAMPKEDRSLTFTLLYGHGAAALAIQSEVGLGRPGSAHSQNRRGSTPPTHAPLSAAKQALIPPADLQRPRSGGQLGTDHNCFYRGYDHFTVPPGSQVVTLAIGLDDDFTAVLRVSRPQDVLEDLTHQLTKDLRFGDTTLPIVERKPVAGGGSTWTFENSVDGGGGYCNAQTDRSGHYVVIHTHSD